MVAQSNLLSDSQVHAFCRDGFCIIQPDVAPRLHKLAAAQITALLAAYAHTHTIDTHRLSRVLHCLWQYQPAAARFSPTDGVVCVILQHADSLR